MTHFIS